MMLRDDKGYSVLASRDTYTALDLETTGLDSHADMIIEIGAIRIRNGDEIERYHQLVNPGRPIPPAVTDITGITDDMVADQPAVEEVLPAFVSWLSDDLILGYNVNFDVNFLYDASVRITGNPVTNDFLDTMRLARYLYPEEKRNRLIDLVNRFGIDETQTHRALDDAEQTIACYEFMRKRISDEDISMPANEGRRSGSASIFRGEDNLLQIAPAEEVTPDPAFDGRTFVFTGALKRMTRENAQRAVSNLGGVNGKGVTKSTNYLVTGSTDYNAALKGTKSSKWLKAEKLQASGQDIHIISEEVFYDMLGDSIAGAPAQSQLKFRIGSSACRDIPDGPIGERVSFVSSVDEVPVLPPSQAKPKILLKTDDGIVYAEFTAQMNAYDILSSIVGKKMEFTATRRRPLIGDKPYFDAKAKPMNIS